jgi:hypothetical protein
MQPIPKPPATYELFTRRFLWAASDVRRPFARVQILASVRMMRDPRRTAW